VTRLAFLEQSMRVLFHAVLIGSLYLLFAGHNQPGGGFVGGLVAGAAISLRYLAGGIAEVRGVSRLKPWTILGTGVAVAASTALAPLALGDPVLTSLGHSFDPPLLGPVYASTTLAFDVGVYMVVVGLVFMVFEAFGDDRDERVEL
jgi:multisubunit Na+/H+ antiporter MnhB subunit